MSIFLHFLQCGDHITNKFLAIAILFTKILVDCTYINHTLINNEVPPIDNIHGLSSNIVCVGTAATYHTSLIMISINSFGLLFINETNIYITVRRQSRKRCMMSDLMMVPYKHKCVTSNVPWQFFPS